MIGALTTPTSVNFPYFYLTMKINNYTNRFTKQSTPMNINGIFNFLKSPVIK